MRIEYYLCAPDYLKLDARYNEWMKEATCFSLPDAISQHKNLVQTLRGIVPDQVFEIAPQPDLTELCFIGDSLFAIDNRAVYSRFSVPERLPETEYAIKKFGDLGFTGAQVSEGIFFEGSGETILLGDTILSGFGIRSQRSAIAILKEFFTQEVVGIELCNPRYHHLDMAFLPLRRDLALCFAAAVTAESLNAIKKLDCEVICLPETELEPFCLNAIVIENTVIIEAGAVRTQDLLSKLGFAVVPVDMSAYYCLGGSVKCLTFQHYIFRD